MDGVDRMDADAHWQHMGPLSVSSLSISSIPSIYPFPLPLPGLISAAPASD
jgi:hypothetical protein